MCHNNGKLICLVPIQNMDILGMPYSINGSEDTNVFSALLRRVLFSNYDGVCRTILEGYGTAKNSSFFLITHPSVLVADK